MQCGDLDKYLDAFLDGGLGRSRGAILRRHLSLCGGCRTRIERLRQFERDVQRRFRSMDQERSIWQGLELDLVASGRASSGPVLALPRLLPAPRHEAGGNRGSAAGSRSRATPLAKRAGRGSRHSRLAGLALIAMALGAVYQIGRGYLIPASDAGAAAQTYGTLLDESHGLALVSGDPRRLEDWLAGELETPVELPATPAGFQLMGADRAELPSGLAGAVVYRAMAGDADRSVLLLVQTAPGDGPATPGETVLFKGRAAGGSDLHELSWSGGTHRFTVLSTLGPEELRRFVDQNG